MTGLLAFSGAFYFTSEPRLVVAPETVPEEKSATFCASSARLTRPKA